MADLIRKFYRNEAGATAIEYALIALLISVTLVGGATAIGNNVSTILTNTSNSFN